MKALLLALAAPLPLLFNAEPAVAPATELAQGGIEKPLKERYADAFASQNMTGLVELWKVNEYRVLHTIDADLEGSLALWEEAMSREGATLTDAESNQIKELHARAVFGARAASEAFDRPIFLDYASAFVSWNAEQKEAFRAGQAAFSEAVGAMGQGDWEGAMKAADRCTELALPLGDWWGTAMGMGMSGAANAQLGNNDTALRLLAQSRLINDGLGLRSAARRDLQIMMGVLTKTEQWQRALATCDDLLSDAQPEERKLLEAERVKFVHALL